MGPITVYQKPTCTTCREVGQILKELGIPFESVNYYIDPLKADAIRKLLKKMALPASALVRKKEEIYKKLGLDKKKTTEDGWIELFAKYPDLMQRPIIEKGAKAILARPAETARAFLK
jgi:arsenate reductase (glutaredoxin)